MVGSAIAAINAAVPAMVQELRKIPYALETVAISVITFSGDARLVVPLSFLEFFKLPELKIHPGTSLGRALDMLASCVGRYVVMTTPERKGDWLPLVFLFTDGQPTDALEGHGGVRLLQQRGPCHMRMRRKHVHQYQRCRRSCLPVLRGCFG
jgi:uncharacterized protein YegL